MQTYPPDRSDAHLTIDATVSSNVTSCIVKSPIGTTLAAESGGSVTRVSLRILHVTKRFWPFDGGVERYVMDLSMAQAAEGHEVRILTIDRDVVGGATRRLARTEWLGPLRITRVAAVGTPRKQFVVGNYGAAIKELRLADVVHHHDPRFLFETAIVIRRSIRKPIIFHTHGMIWHTAQFGRLKQIAMRWYYGPILRRLVDAVIADSDADADSLATTGGVAGPKVRRLPNAVDLRRFSAIDRRPERGLLVSFGRLDTHKGLDRLFPVLAAVSEPWRLIVAGTGQATLTDRLQLDARRLGISDRIKWVGRISDDALSDLLARAWVAVFPSRYEGFGLALVEALASGVPALASDLPTHREILGADSGSSLVPFDDAEEAGRVIDASLRWTSRDARQRSAAGRARAATFDMTALQQRISELYCELGLVVRPDS